MKKTGNRETALILLGIFIVGFFVFFTNNFYKSVWEKSGLEEAEETRNYDKQYEMIVGSGKNEFWQAVYESALEAAQEHDAYVQFHARDMGDGYDEIDYMEISIAAGADGIILEFNGEESLKAEINKAVEAGIPVITIMSDAPDSSRQSFVGPNDYQVGQEKSQIYSQISTAVMEEDHGQKIDVKAESMTSDNKFDIEEVIRSIFQAPEGPPQILVCMDEITTECAYQAMIDFNMVGEIKIIGYYVSDTIQKAVEKGLIPVTSTLDTAKMGKNCVEALWEFEQEGRVNSYYNVELQFLTKEDIRDAMPTDSGEE